MRPAILVAIAFLALAACAGPPALSAKLPDLAGIDLARGPAPSYRDAITVAAVGVGTDTATPWTSEAGPAQVKEALIRTLIAARLERAESGRFRLDADSTTGAVVYTATLTTPGTATLNDAYMSDFRLRIADESAVRANFRRLVEELYALPDRSIISSPRT